MTVANGSEPKDTGRPTPPQDEVSLPGEANPGGQAGCCQPRC